MLNQHWQVRLSLRQPDFIYPCRMLLGALAMLCIAGAQFAVVTAMLLLAAKRESPPKAQGMLDVLPDGTYVLYESGSAAKNRVLHAYWKGPCWITLALSDPYFPASRCLSYTVWSFTQHPGNWRRLCALVQATRWQSAHRELTGAVS